MGSNAARSSGSGADRFLLLVTNLSETNRLLPALVDVAPAEIANDMEIVAEVWARQADAVGDTGAEPMGALGAIFVSAMLSSASVNSIDEWSTLNCGQPVFGAGLTAAGSQSCTWLSGTGSVAFATVLRPEAEYGSLVDALETVRDNTVAGPSTAAVQLLASTADLNPVPRYSLEAIGRLAWTDVDALALLDEIAAGVGDLCGVAAFGQDDQNAARAMGPVSTDDRQASRIGSLFRRCSWPLPAGDFGLLYDCNTGAAHIDLLTGDVHWIDGPSMDINDKRFAVNAGDHVYWISWLEEPAEGLNPPRYSTVLNAVDYTTFNAVSVELDAQENQYSGPEIEIVTTTADRVAISIDGALEVYDGSLDLLSSAPSGRLQPVTDGTVLLSRGGGMSNGEAIDTLLDLRTGAATDVAGGTADIDRGRMSDPGVWRSPCRDRAVIEVGGTMNPVARIVVLNDDTGASTLGPATSADFVQNNFHVLVAPDTYLVKRDHRGIGLDGTPRWQLPDNVAKEIFDLGGWVIVVNFSDEPFILDPTTGKEVDLPPAFDRAVEATLTANGVGNSSLERVTVDWQHGNATMQTSSEIWQMPATTFCPTAYDMIPTG